MSAPSGHWDTHALWEGRPQARRSSPEQESRRYRLTRDALHFEGDGDRRTKDLVPVAIVVAATVSRTPRQRFRGLGDIRLELDPTVRPLQAIATIVDIEDPGRVRDLIMELATQARRAAQARRDREIAAEHARPRADHSTAGIAQDLRELAELRDRGVIGELEFEQLKARRLAED